MTDIQTNPLSDLISDEDENEHEDDNNNFDNMCDILKPTKSSLKKEIQELKQEVKRLEKNSILFLNKFRKDGRYLLNEYKKQF